MPATGTATLLVSAAHATLGSTRMQARQSILQQVLTRSCWRPGHSRNGKWAWVIQQATTKYADAECESQSNTRKKSRGSCSVSPSPYLRSNSNQFAATTPHLDDFRHKHAKTC
jgi:hypothetical protein